MMTAVHSTLSNNKHLQYNKDLIEKIIYKSTHKNVEVLLSYEHNITNLNCANKLIEQVNVYLMQQKQTLLTNSQHHLVMCINQNDMVDMSYLGYLSYSTRPSGWPIWEMLITPLINCIGVRRDMYYLDEMLAKISVLVQPPALRWYNDTNIVETHIAKAIEHAILRITYNHLNIGNIEQYKQKLEYIYDHEVGVLEKTHAMILENLSIDDMHKVNTINLENLDVSVDELLILGDSIIT